MIDVVAACLMFESQFLVAQKSENEPLALKWEFPGGKIKLGESDIQALQRELKEELNICLNPETPMQFLGEFPHTYPHISVRLKAYLIRVDDPSYKLIEHKSVRWVSPEELKTIDFAEADLAIIDQLIQTLDLM